MTEPKFLNEAVEIYESIGLDLSPEQEVQMLDYIMLQLGEGQVCN